MIYGYARVSTDGRSVEAQVKQLRQAGAGKVFRETAAARADRLSAGFRRSEGKDRLGRQEDHNRHHGVSEFSGTSTHSADPRNQ